MNDADLKTPWLNTVGVCQCTSLRCMMWFIVGWSVQIGDSVYSQFYHYLISHNRLHQSRTERTNISTFDTPDNEKPPMHY